MLIIALEFSAILLLVANLLVFVGRRTGWTTVWPAVMLLSALASFCLFPPVSIQALLLALAASAVHASGRRPATFLPLSLVATGAAYAIAGLMVSGTLREYASLRALYPYESMEARVPAPRPGPRAAPLPDAVRERLARWEEGIHGREDFERAWQFRMIHERAVALFIDAPGFGALRMKRPRRSHMTLPPRTPAPDQPGPRAAPPWSPGESERFATALEPSLERIFEESVQDFANPKGFGYIKDRRHVAGFEAHRFAEVPAAPDRWIVRTLDLVGLLLHEEPVAYVSDRLPQMDELRGAPTRPLDNFEASALAAVRRGDDPFIIRSGGLVRMLGGIRSVSQCVACHGGERGDLLGAFSYTIR